MTPKEREKIISLFEQYDGQITESEDRISIEADNIVSNGRNSKKIRCVVRIIFYDRKKGFNWSVHAETKNLEILGGCASPCDDFDEAIRKAKGQLQHYNFQKIEQMSLF